MSSITNVYSNIIFCFSEYISWCVSLFMEITNRVFYIWIHIILKCIVIVVFSISMTNIFRHLCARYQPHLTLTAAGWGKLYHPHFTADKTEVMGGWDLQTLSSQLSLLPPHQPRSLPWFRVSSAPKVPSGSSFEPPGPQLPCLQVPCLASLAR